MIATFYQYSYLIKFCLTNHFLSLLKASLDLKVLEQSLLNREETILFSSYWEIRRKFPSETVCYSTLIAMCNFLAENVQHLALVSPSFIYMVLSIMWWRWWLWCCNFKSLCTWWIPPDQFKRSLIWIIIFLANVEHSLNIS